MNTQVTSACMEAYPSFESKKRLAARKDATSARRVLGASEPEQTFIAGVKLKVIFALLAIFESFINF